MHGHVSAGHTRRHTHSFTFWQDGKSISEDVFTIQEHKQLNPPGDRGAAQTDTGARTTYRSIDPTDVFIDQVVPVEKKKKERK